MTHPFNGSLTPPEGQQAANGNKFVRPPDGSRFLNHRVLRTCKSLPTLRHTQSKNKAGKRRGLYRFPQLDTAPRNNKEIINDDELQRT